MLLFKKKFLPAIRCRRKNADDPAVERLPHEVGPAQLHTRRGLHSRAVGRAGGDRIADGCRCPARRLRIGRGTAPASWPRCMPGNWRPAIARIAFASSCCRPKSRRAAVAAHRAPNWPASESPPRGADAGPRPTVEFGLSICARPRAIVCGSSATRMANTSRITKPHVASHRPCLRPATATAHNAWRKRSFQTPPAGDALPVAAGDQRHDCAAVRKISSHQVHPHLGHGQGTAGPRAVVDRAGGPRRSRTAPLARALRCK